MPLIKEKSTRLFFIDAIRAWAILMMLQGHFIDGLLDPIYRDAANTIYAVWQYFRGITAPVFFTVSGFIFTYLLIRVPQKGLQNPRIRKGVKRGLQLLFIGYLLRVNIFGLFQGKIYPSFFLVDVLHIIGLAILLVIGLYLLTSKLNRTIFPMVLIGITVMLFTLEPIYASFSYPNLPKAISNYFTRGNGSVFTIIPWFGYTTAGGFLSVLFFRFRNHPNLYKLAIPLSAVVGGLLIFLSSPIFAEIYAQTGWELFNKLQLNNYLYIRLGDVLVTFAVFMVFRNFLMQKTVLRIGQNTLSIYVIHFIILYGSFTGLGLYQFFHHTVSPGIVIPGALLFMLVCSYLALQYDTHETSIKSRFKGVNQVVGSGIRRFYKQITKVLKT